MSRSLAACALLVALACPAASPVLSTASAAPNAGAANDTAVNGTATDSGAQIAPTVADVEAQKQRLEQLRADIGNQSEGLERAEAEQAAAALEAATALERYALSVRSLQASQQAENDERQGLDAAQAALDSQRVELGRWARQAYQQGEMGLDDHPVVVTFLQSQTTDDLSSAVVMLKSVGRARSRTLTGFARAQQAQATATDRAVAATNLAAAAAATADAAKRDKDAAVAAQRAVVDSLSLTLDATRDQAELAEQETDRLRIAVAREQAREAARLARDAAMSGTRSNLVIGEVGECTGGDMSAYANGEIPLDALCPLWGSPGQYLRADAAFAFDKLSHAYAAAFGLPICVTDSYRTLQGQITLYAQKPKLAAVPGTSNHGWGTATDLCDGVQHFSTETHDWMVVNAPLYGWFHPSWAGAGGSRPEPWHFEFGG